MTEKQFDKLMEDSGKRVKESLKIIRKSSEKCDRLAKEILGAL